MITLVKKLDFSTKSCKCSVSTVEEQLLSKQTKKMKTLASKIKVLVTKISNREALQNEKEMSEHRNNNPIHAWGN